MQIGNLKRKTSLRRAKRVGRAGNRGKTSGRGTKGQNARAGHKKRPEIRDIIKKIPKKRGYQFTGLSINSAAVTLEMLNKVFNDGDSVTLETLRAKKLIPSSASRAKILTAGNIEKSLTVSGVGLSKTAKDSIEKAGGKVE